MTEISFYARGDSNSANNSSLNVQGTSTTPTTLLTFSSGTSGDIQLDFNGGLPDPDTWLILGGVTMTFTVEFSGYLPQTNKLSNVNGQNLQGKEIVVITAENGQRFFFLTDGSGTLATMNAFPNGAHSLTALTGTDPILVCFLAGTLIATPTGERPVESLRPGDAVWNDAKESVTLRWTGHRRIGVAEALRHPEFRPVVIPRDHFGPGQPHTDLAVSPQHRIMLSDWRVELLFGCERALVPAIHLCGGPVRRIDAVGPFDYYHLLFDAHEIVRSNGLASESFQPGVRSRSFVETGVRGEIDRLFPDIGRSVAEPRRDHARSLRAHEARALLLATQPHATQRAA